MQSGHCLSPDDDDDDDKDDDDKDKDDDNDYDDDDDQIMRMRMSVVVLLSCSSVQKTFLEQQMPIVWGRRGRGDCDDINDNENDVSPVFVEQWMQRGER